MIIRPWDSKAEYSFIVSQSGTLTRQEFFINVVSVCLSRSVLNMTSVCIILSGLAYRRSVLCRSITRKILVSTAALSLMDYISLTNGPIAFLGSINFLTATPEQVRAAKAWDNSSFCKGKTTRVLLLITNILELNRKSKYTLEIALQYRYTSVIVLSPQNGYFWCRPRQIEAAVQWV